MDRRLGGSQNLFGHGVEEMDSQPLRESNPNHPIIQAQPVTIPTELSRLTYMKQR
jgi:hypothetical protein